MSEPPETDPSRLLPPPGRSHAHSNEKSRSGVAKTANGDTLAVQEWSRYQGSLPHPDIIRGYEDVLPGAADRILSLTERQAKHRQDLERHRAKWIGVGLVFGFITVIGTVSSGVALIALGFQVTGLVALLAPLATLAGVFVYAAYQKGKEDKHPGSP